jgi:hypothetical protein
MLYELIPTMPEQRLILSMERFATCITAGRACNELFEFVEITGSLRAGLARYR